MNFYPHHIKDFNNSTRHLTRVERSVYRDLTEHYYVTESLITLDLDKLARRILCRTEEEKQAIIDVLDEFFDKTDEGYFHFRCDEEIRKYRANTTAKAKAGIASGKARAAKRKQKGTPVKSRSTPAANHKPVTSNHKPIIESIFSFWQTTFNHPKAKLDTKRSNAIQSALNLGYSEDHLLQAIQGCAKTPWNMGDNPTNTIYDSLTLILRDAEHIDKFYAAFTRPANAQSKSSGNTTKPTREQREDALRDFAAGN